MTFWYVAILLSADVLTMFDNAYMSTYQNISGTVHDRNGMLFDVEESAAR